MIVIGFTQEAIEALEYQRYHQAHPRVHCKFQAIWLKSQGLTHHELCDFERYYRRTQCGLTCANIRLGVLRRSNNSITTYRKVNCRLIKPQLKIIFGQIHRRLLTRLWQKSKNSPVSTTP